MSQIITLDNCYTLKPKELIFSELNWKYLYRSTQKSKNILILGNSGCGKTLSAQSIAKVLDRPFFYFNCGAMQDPRSSLIGNTQYDKTLGTFFSESYFINAIKTKNAIILLDELSRCHPDGWNILLPALDKLQRYVRLDEKTDNETVKVAEGVCFIATANIGNEYTATRVMDRALLDRFSVIIEVTPLSDVEELSLLKGLYPEVSEEYLSALTQITQHTRDQFAKEGGKVTNYISTRLSVEIAELFGDGFSFKDVLEVSVYPFFSKEGGADSERTYIKQFAQQYIKSTGDAVGTKPAEEREDPF